jgi:hypothetical protein
MMAGFAEYIRDVTVNKYYALSAPYTLQITIEHTKFSQSVTAFTSLLEMLSK